MMLHDKVTRRRAIGDSIAYPVAMEADLLRQIAVKNGVVDRAHQFS
jgi:hypothetical protein